MQVSETVQRELRAQDCGNGCWNYIVGKAIRVNGGFALTVHVLRACFRLWKPTAHFAKTDQEKNRLKRNRWRKRDKEMEDKINAASAEGDFREIWKLARIAGGKGIGPKKRLLRQAKTVDPSLDEWLRAMEKTVRKEDVVPRK